MRPSALVFLVVLAGAAAAWALAVLPLHGEASAMAARIAGADLREGRESSADPVPTAEEARRLGESLAALRLPDDAPAPRGMAEEAPGTFAGRLPWEEVQGLLAWAAECPRPVLEIEVRALPGDPARASCRVVLGR